MILIRASKLKSAGTERILRYDHLHVTPKKGDRSVQYQSIQGFCTESNVLRTRPKMD